ncbi:inactive leucine-rich repeat receptor-like serine/threonine-protein kinase At1g60630 [Salvia miltiorrhiza]|uniref:inactive leucine-rich repeat receptor-like serine/threonine-protein kinase At1g60630 n=1 Tax=Salvia miltiorrhiza TaxID=226208 RepID=UPI0025AC8CD3|nr:inactive leucine-rich repeat receptor-like serine/threonine-protein kinase At1g60630 [Salvia miltiorrhiza]
MAIGFCLFLLVLAAFPQVRSGDAEALLSLKASIDPLGVLQWQQGIDVCKWEGVKQCLNGRVMKLVVEGFNLSGRLNGESLNQLDQLRVLSFKENSLSGEIPQLAGLVNLKSLFLNDNRFSGGIPAGLSALHRLKVVVLSGNGLSGPIPRSLLELSRLYVLYLQDNQLSGGVPPFSQNTLRFFNVSNNLLSGEIPKTAVLVRFNSSSFVGNADLCGEQIQKPCILSPSSSPSMAPSKNLGHRKRNKKLVLIIVSSVGGFALLCTATVLLIVCLRKRRKGKEGRDKVVARGGDEGARSGVGRDDSGRASKQGSLSWDQGGDGVGVLAFLGPGDQLMSYSMEDLLKASAETLGRGTMGSTYKAVMESGYIVTVKRLKESRYPRMEEFRRHIEILGRLRHPNLVPLRAYFHAKEERLLVYDYFPNGSLFSLVHGTKSAGGSKPLHWTSCLKIAEDLAAALVHIHQNPGLTHGNLKATNVLLGSDFESCLTDYGLTPLRNPDSHEEPGASSLFYRAPECRDPRKPVTQEADVYSYGVLLLELLTGKTPFQDLVEEHGSDIPKWVRSVREETTESGDEHSSGNEGSEEKLNALLNIAMACVCVAVGSRPAMKDVVRMIREARAEAQTQVSSNSSDHSPGRWSDTVQSLTREDHSSI